MIMEHLFLQFLIIIIFLTVVFLHVSKKNSTAITLYLIQSLAITAVLLVSFFGTYSILLLAVALLTFTVKAIIAPLFFSRLVKKHQLKFSASTYMNAPTTLIMVAILTAITSSHLFAPLVSIIPANEKILSLSMAVILIAFFLIINRKGAISQMIGILSLENGIVSFAIFSGLEQAPGLQAGIMFNIFIWIMIATMFASMIYKQFGSLDVTEMKSLKE